MKMKRCLLLAALAPLLPQERVPVAPVAPGPASGGPVELALRVYDVGHLVGHDRLRRLADELAVDAESRLGAFDRETLDAYAALQNAVAATMESVANAMRDMLEPAFDERVNRVVRLRGGTLAVAGTPEQHAWLRAFVDHATGFDGLVDIHTRIYRLERGQLAELGQDRSSVVLSAADLRVLLEQLDHRSDERVVAPRVLARPFQQAELKAVEEIAYIRDYELTILPDRETEIAGPVIAMAERGVRLRMRCVPLANGKLSVDADVLHSDVEEPIPTQEITLGARAQRVTVQKPTVTQVHLEGRFEVDAGEGLLMAATDPDGDQEVVLILRASRVREER